jgi:hypothetical protein
MANLVTLLRLILLFVLVVVALKPFFTNMKQINPL